MNGAHDMGGMHGFGPVVREENEPLFHAAWERTVYGINRAIRSRGIINIDESRHGIERMPPAEYLAASYYERWLSSLERVLVEKGIVSQAEFEARVALLQEHPNTPQPQRDDPELYQILTTSTSGQAQYQRETSAPRFAAGVPDPNNTDIGTGALPARPLGPSFCGGCPSRPPKRSPAGPPPPAPLRARQARHDRGDARRLRAPRHARPWPGRAAPADVHRL